MLKSMTGFGRGEAVGQGWHVKVEMKSVNHRYLDLTAASGGITPNWKKPLGALSKTAWPGAALK